MCKKRIISLLLLVILSLNIFANDKVTVTISSIPDGASIYLNGKKIGVTPYVGEVDEGKYDIVLKLKGYKEFKVEDVYLKKGNDFMLTDVELKIENKAKPFYKQIWFWGLFAVASGATVYAISSSGDSGGSTLSDLPLPPSVPNP